MMKAWLALLALAPAAAAEPLRTPDAFYAVTDAGFGPTFQASGTGSSFVAHQAFGYEHTWCGLTQLRIGGLAGLGSLRTGSNPSPEALLGGEAGVEWLLPTIQLGPRVAVEKEEGSEIAGTKFTVGARVRMLPLVLGADLSYRPFDSPNLGPNQPSQLDATFHVGFELDATTVRGSFAIAGIDVLALIATGVAFVILVPPR